MKLVFTRKNFVLLICLLLGFTAEADAQVRSGAAFLKIQPGARSQALAGGLAGSLNDLWTLYSNPASTGIGREWQWGAAYSRWFGDIYSTSFVINRQLTSRGLRRTHLGLAVSYLGVPFFDSSDRSAPEASANELLATVNLARPFRLGNRGTISIGTNLKYYRSTLVDITAQSFLADAGVLLRSPRFPATRIAGFLEPLGDAIISAGLSLNHYGKALEYLNVSTPLPRTLRAGAALILGKHNGLQIQLSTDTWKTLDESTNLSFGTELSWGQLFSLRGGYSLEEDLFGRFSFGMGLHFGDHLAGLQNVLPGGHNHLDVDFASAETDELFNAPYRGTVLHQPVRPESFYAVSPDNGITIRHTTTRLTWTDSRDPDLFDNVRFQVLLDRDSLKIDHYLSTIPAARTSEQTDISFLVNQITNKPELQYDDLTGGSYYWTVIALDTDGHYRLMGEDDKHIQRFDVPMPELEIRDITFRHSRWLESSDYQGQLVIAIRNRGDFTATKFNLGVRDVFSPRLTNKGADAGISENVFKEETVAELQPGETDTLLVDWYTNIPGQHAITAEIDVLDRIPEKNESNNALTREFVTIPRGFATTDDTVTAFVASRVTYDLPFIAEVHFDENRAKVKPVYLSKWVIEPPLAILARRLREHQNLQIRLQGYIDPNSNEVELDLATRRAYAVRDSLVEMGVAPTQLKVLAGQILPERRAPSNAIDAQWLYQERRHVKILTEAGEHILFEPVRYTDLEKLPLPVVFLTQVESVTGLEQASLHLRSEFLTDSLNANSLMRGKGMDGLLNWSHQQSNARIAGQWVGRDVAYSLRVRDALGRNFRTRPDSVRLLNQSNLREQRFSWPLKFAGTEPFYDFYWRRLFQQINRMLRDESMRMRFIGHACAVGPESINRKLSVKRAQVFHNSFLRRVREDHPEAYDKILQRLDPPVGYGESRPLGVVRTNGRFFLIGNNDLPVGRTLNRRIEISFYSNEKPLDPDADLTE